MDGMSSHASVGPACPRLHGLAQLPATLYTFRIDVAGVPSFPFVSEACAEIYGFTSDDAMADVSLMHEAVHPDDRQGFDEAGQQSLRELQPLRWGGRIRRGDGTERRVFITSQPSRLGDGATEWQGLVVQHPDRSPSFGETDLDARMSHLHADTLGMLGHDLAAPLTSIMVRAELALEEVNVSAGSRRRGPGADNGVIRRNLELILRQAHRMNDMRADLLAAAAADAHD